MQVETSIAYRAVRSLTSTPAAVFCWPPKVRIAQFAGDSRDAPVRTE